MNDVLKIFTEIVQIASPSKSEEAMVAYVCQFLEKLKIKYSVDDIGNIYASTGKLGSPVLLCAHLDTVEPGQGVKPIITQGFVTSDGTTILGADNKSSVAAILASLSAIQKTNRHVELLFTVREETDSGIKYFDLKKLQSKHALVADSGENIGTVILNSPWILELEVDFFGKSSHSSVPNEGINALAAAINALSRLPVGKVDTSTVVNFGLINGGDAVNTVPGWINVKGEIRSFCEEELEKTLSLVTKIFKGVEKDFSVRADFKYKNYCNGYFLTKSDPFVVAIYRLLKKLTKNVKFLDSYGATDANFLAENGIKTLNIGDGCKDVHTCQERIKVKDLEKLSAIFYEFTQLPDFTGENWFDKLSKTQ